MTRVLRAGNRSIGNNWRLTCNENGTEIMERDRTSVLGIILKEINGIDPSKRIIGLGGDGFCITFLGRKKIEQI